MEVDLTRPGRVETEAGTRDPGIMDAQQRGGAMKSTRDCRVVLPRHKIGIKGYAS